MIRSEAKLQTLLNRIEPLNEAAMAAAQARLDRLTKPPGSLGQLEAYAVRLAGIAGEVHATFPKKAVVVMAADHGVVAEGVSAFPPEVTPQMVRNFLSGGAAINALARLAGADVVCIDVGVAADIDHPALVRRKVRCGTANFTMGPAMTRAEALEALCVGIGVAEELADRGYRLLATGEMGIGNTTSAAAILAAFTGDDPARCVGRGTGVDDAALARKAEVVRRALAVNRPDPQDPVDVLHKVGGLEIAALAGLMLGAATRRVPVVVDGFPASSAALVACRLAPRVKDYLFPSHQSAEQGHRRLLEVLGFAPPLHLDMRLGEGTGAVLTFHLLEAACRIRDEMATFEAAGVSGPVAKEEAARS
ncbi:MAG: nicotinate-nucleotide--dimethylbenzimidazole phosphoribosyltransferase [Bacillota bacterium]